MCTVNYEINEALQILECHHTSLVPRPFGLKFFDYLQYPKLFWHILRKQSKKQTN